MLISSTENTSVWVGVNKYSKTIGYDVLLTMYPGNRYELECKYTGYGQCMNF